MADLIWYEDILANVRRDGKFHSVKELVQPWDIEVQAVATLMGMKGEFIANCQDFVYSFAKYRTEFGDFWSYPRETLNREWGDCDCLAILLCSLLRNRYAPDEVYCAFGNWRGGGHMWVIMEGPEGEDRVIESTAPSNAPLKGVYYLMAMFNDKLTFATTEGIKKFNLKVVPKKEVFIGQETQPAQRC